MLECNDLHVGYGAYPVLKGIRLAVNRGMLVSVIGVNGCGKRTLLQTMMGLLSPTEGTITVDGRSLTDFGRKETAKQIAYLAQGNQCPPMTVTEAVLLGRYPHLCFPRDYSKRDRAVAHAAMARMGLTALEDEPLASLSGGMRQKVFVAMALAQDTDYILMDEPTTYLDIAHQLELMSTLRTLADEGKGILTVMHDLPLAFSFSDRVALMDEGHITFFGTPSELCETDLLPRIFGVGVEFDGKGYRYLI